MDISFIIPAYNEEKVIGSTLKNLLDALSDLPPEYRYEVIVIDDGSTDKTRENASSVKEVFVISHPYNIGYGAAIKTGVRSARYDWIFVLDGDGQHKPGDLSLFFKMQKHGYDLIIGKRKKGAYQSWIRRPGKAIMTLMANYLSDIKIQDLNSGMRLFRKSAFFNYMPLYPNGFSISTTMTLAFAGDGYSIAFVPIMTYERIGGQSNVHIMRDGFNAMVMIVRTISLFNPLKVFLPCAVVSGSVGLFLIISDMIKYGSLPKSAILMLMGALLIFLFGLLSDQIALLRRQNNEMDKRIQH